MPIITPSFLKPFVVRTIQAGPLRPSGLAMIRGQRIQCLHIGSILALYRLYIGIADGLSHCAGMDVREAVILSVGTPIPVQCACRRQCRDEPVTAHCTMSDQRFALDLGLNESAGRPRHAAQHSAAPNFTAPRSAAPHSAALHGTALHGTARHGTALQGGLAVCAHVCAHAHCTMSDRLQAGQHAVLF